MNKEILVVGAGGLVGSRFVELSKYRGLLVTPDSKRLDITGDLGSLDADIVINFAVDADVTRAETQRGDENGSCWQVNVIGVQNLLRALRPNTKFIQISTDMVFSGSSARPGPYAEDDQPETDASKVTWYGNSKRHAEELVKARRRSAILRLIYPVRANFPRKLDYLRKPLSFFDKGKLYPLYTNQQMSISYIDDICRILDEIIEQDAEGIFHAGSSDLTTPFAIVSDLIEKARGKRDVVQPTLLEETVRYPKFGGLLVTKTKSRSCGEIVEQLVRQGI